MDKRVGDSRQGSCQGEAALNEGEIIAAALTLHTTSFTFSLAAIYAVFGDKFVRPTIERADDLCARLRGELAAELGQALRPFVLSDKPPAVANVNVLFGPDGKPLEVAAITNAASLDSEAFQDAVRGFLDGESADFDRYRQAFNLRTTIKGHWNTIKTITGIWPIFSLIAISVFWLLSKQSIPTPPQSWLWTIVVLPILPLLLFISRFPLLARCSNLLEKLEV
jgi:hypothetical protein